jgi:hypothetical protein
MRHRPSTLVAIAFLGAAASVGCQPANRSATTEDPGRAVAAVFDGTGGTWIDLTHAFSDRTIYWPTDTLGFVHEKLAYGETEGGWFYSSYATRPPSTAGLTSTRPSTSVKGNGRTTRSR